MGWDKKVCGFGLAGWVRVRSFFDRINRIKEDEEDKMIFISCPVNPLNFVNPDNEKGPRQTSMGWRRGRSFLDRINRIDRIRNKIILYSLYPLHPLNPVNPVKIKSLTPPKNFSEDRARPKPGSFDLTIIRTHPFRVFRLLIECHPHLSAQTLN